MSSLIVPSPPIGPTSVIAGLILCAVVARFITRKRSKLSLPPGPPADPLIGHVRTFPPPERRAEVFHEWSKIYGEVFSLQVPGKTIVVLNSEKAASDLLEKRSAIYSDRPRFSFYDALGWGDTIIFAAYGPFHNRQRKLYSDAFGKNVVSNYDHMQERGANVLIQSLMNLPEAFDRHAQLFAGGLVSEIAYGHRIESFDDKFFEAGEEYIRLSVDATTPSLLDLHPLFKYWPTWAPWSGFAKTLKEIQPHMNAIIYNTYNRVQEQMSAGTAKPSFTSKHLESIYRGERGSNEHRALQLAASMVFAAGYDTTYHTVVMFIACMMQNPEVQRKAQEEIDRVVGRGRLPDLSDRDSLPYLQCVMYETLRWHPVVPIGLPHQVTVDDEYNGMRIPKGAMIIANTRSITWDETKFKDARLYKPGRFLPKPEGDGEIFPAGAVFGWGRRICAGRYLAERSVWLALARILATLNISPAKDAEGNLMPTNVITSTSITLNIEPFMCDIRPRDEKAARLIQDAPIE